MAFPDSAMTAFGPEMITSYYAWLLDGPHEAALMGAWHDQRLIGFCAAGVFRGLTCGFLRAHRLRLVLHVLRHPRLLVSSHIRARIRSATRITLRYSRVGRAATPPPGPPQFGVVAIATAPGARGSGAGKELMREAEDRARRTGHHRMVLTVHPDNVHAIRFYERLGWRRIANGHAWTGGMEKLL
jgi:ribosomal protein S18 acetylase RimI-like enzyme